MRRVITILVLILCYSQTRAQFSGLGSGTEESPYLITTALNVEEIRNYQGVKGVQFRLMNDIDMTELIEDTYGDAGWNPIPDFLCFHSPDICLVTPRTSHPDRCPV